MTLNIFTVFHNHHHYPIPEYFHHHPQKNPHIFHSPIPHYPLAVSKLICFSVDLPILDSSYKWKYTICGLSWLASFISIMFSRFIYIVAGISTSFFCCWQIIPFIDIPHFIYPFISWWRPQWKDNVNRKL